MVTKRYDLSSNGYFDGHSNIYCIVRYYISCCDWPKVSQWFRDNPKENIRIKKPIKHYHCCYTYLEYPTTNGDSGRYLKRKDKIFCVPNNFIRANLIFISEKTCVRCFPSNFSLSLFEIFSNFSFSATPACYHTVVVSLQINCVLEKYLRV